MLRNILIISCLCIGLPYLQGQDMRWSKHAKLADELYEQAKYGEAAEHYEAAYEKKSKKKELIYRAGECYAIVRNYQKAVEAFAEVQNDVKDFPLVGLQYGRALKQSGQYDKASTVLNRYLGEYTGEDAEVVRQIVQAEIEGCELARQLADNPSPVDVQHTGGVLNSPETEFSPFPVGRELYLSSTKDGDKARIYKSKKENEQWSAPEVAEQFLAFEGKHYCNPAFSPDGQRIYFTVCESVETWGYLTSRCEIYVTSKTGNIWSQAVRLPNSINVSDYTSTQPTVVHENGKEILYYASNRPNGQGGMDLWYTIRNLDGAALAFSEPVNVGPQINTIGNEITPFYDNQNKTLYFSSNGQTTTGGYDIFRTAGQQLNWEQPVNLGLPFNSPADDYFYIVDKYGSIGYLASNRLQGAEKTSTEHEDIFTFLLKPSELVVIDGVVTDDLTMEPIKDVNISLSEILDGERKKIVSTNISPDGKYSLETMRGRTYEIVAHAAGYQPTTVTFVAAPDANAPAISLTSRESLTTDVNTNNENVPTPRPNVNSGNNYGNNIPSNPNVNTPPPSNEEYIYTPQAPGENSTIRTSAPRLTGTYFKVQLIAVSNFDPNHRRYRDVKDLGRLDTEFIIDRGLTRVLMGDYMSKEEAFDMLNAVQQNGFSGAFVVRYMDGERQGMLRR